MQNRKTSEVFNTNDGWASGLVRSEDSYISCASQINATHAVLTGGKNNPGWMTIITREREVTRVAMEPVWGHGCLLTPGGLMLAGGFEGKIISNRSRIYNFGTKQWEQTVNMISARASFSRLVLLQEEVWAFGGLTPDRITANIK